MEDIYNKSNNLYIPFHLVQVHESCYYHYQSICVTYNYACIRYPVNYAFNQRHSDMLETTDYWYIQKIKILEPFDVIHMIMGVDYN